MDRFRSRIYPPVPRMHDEDHVRRVVACPDCTSTVTLEDKGTVWDVWVSHSPTCPQVPEVLRDH